MKYRIYNYLENWIINCNDWWEMIYHIHGRLEKIAHNYNDVSSYFEAYFDDSGELRRKIRYEHDRTLIVFDEYDRIINLSEIRDSARIYREKPRKYKKRLKFFIYRYDPVPHISSRKNWWRGCYRKTDLNLKYYTDVMSYMNDARIRTQFRNKSGSFWDDGIPRVSQRCWKKQRKTQWK